MCTAISYNSAEHYFGRNLDYDRDFGEQICITPRNYRFEFRKMGTLETHYAIIGMATVAENYPLYFDATNEKGLSIAGLNFPGNAVYKPYAEGMDNAGSFEIIPWILGKCANVGEAEALLARMNALSENFSESMPMSPLHWMISDKERSIVAEPLDCGIKVYENPVGVLTNNPTFDYHMTNLCNYMGVTRELPVNRFTDKLPLEPYSLGMGGIGLPGDLSSASRFVKAAFVKLNSVQGDSESENVSQFFHILTSVEQPNGCTRVASGDFEYTIYSSCCNTDRGIYYYTTYDNCGVSAVDMNRENLDGDSLILYPRVSGLQINMQN